MTEHFERWNKWGTCYRGGLFYKFLVLIGVKTPVDWRKMMLNIVAKKTLCKVNLSDSDDQIDYELIAFYGNLQDVKPNYWAIVKLTEPGAKEIKVPLSWVYDVKEV